LRTVNVVGPGANYETPLVLDDQVSAAQVQPAHVPFKWPRTVTNVS
jgi:hypothetical protein